MFGKYKDIEISEFQPLANQLSGHGLKKDKDSQIFFFDIPGGFIAKRLKKYSRGYQEADFYREISMSTNIVEKNLSSFFPKFYGMTEYAETNEKFIYLENILCKLIKATSADIKIGFLKKEKYAAADEVLFQIGGMRVYSPDNSYYKFDKLYGRQLDPLSIQNELRKFFMEDHKFGDTKRTKILEHLGKLFDLMKKQSTWHFISSSVIIAYENENIGSPRQDDVTVKMIDFSHTLLAKSKDEYSINSLRNLIIYISNLFL